MSFPVDNSVATPRFSIVVCTWNSEPYVAQAIASVLSQVHSNLELIFVDGGSTDGTLERIQALDCEKMIIENVRGGVARAMNVGLAAARGDLVAHLHADDYYLHDRVLVEVAAAFDSSAADWVFGRAMSDMNDGRLLPEGYAVPRYSYKQLLRANFIPHQATFVKRALFDRVGDFDARYRFAMDYDMWLRLGKVSEPLQVDKHWVAFRRHAGSLTTGSYAKSQREGLKVRMKHAGNGPIAYLEHGSRFLLRQGGYYRRQLGAGLRRVWQ